MSFGASGWTEEQVESLTAYAMVDRLTSQQIADKLSRQFSRDFSRSSICAKCARIGIKLPGVEDTEAQARAKTPRQPRAMRPPAIKKPPAAKISAPPCAPSVSTAGLVLIKTADKRRTARALLAGARPPLPPPAPDALPLAERSGAMNAMFDLGRRHCRWPNGEPAADDFHYCAAPIDPNDGPYCSHHVWRGLHGAQ